MKHHNPQISLVICTKNRSHDLRECLESIITMKPRLNELVVVDNDSTDDTKNVVLAYKSIASFPIRHIIEHKKGYPFIYNRGIHSSRSPWVAFIDDDCIAEDQWYEALVHSIQKHPDAVAILGQSKTYYHGNLFSLATLFNNYHWKLGKIKGENVIDHEILDNKNIAYNRRFLTTCGISFDERRSRLMHGAAEDCDLGMQLSQAGGKAVYSRAMVVWHKDPKDILTYLTKTIRSYQSYITYYDKWKTYRQTRIPAIKRVKTLPAIARFGRLHHVSADKTLLLIVLLYTTYLIKHIAMSWHRFVRAS